MNNILFCYVYVFNTATDDMFGDNTTPPPQLPSPPSTDTSTDALLAEALLESIVSTDIKPSSTGLFSIHCHRQPTSVHCPL